VRTVPQAKTILVAPTPQQESRIPNVSSHEDQTECTSSDKRICEMTAITKIGRIKLLIVAGVMLLGSSTAGLAYASGAFSAAQPTSSTNFTVYIGGGHNGDDFTNFQYTPDTLNIFAG
jgi:hypothetical protein